MEDLDFILSFNTPFNNKIENKMMDKLLKDLCCRLPYRPKGRLDNGTECELVGVSLKDLEKPTLDVMVPGYKAPWTCDLTMFKPYLKPLFPTIYEKQEDGIVPWLEFKKRWYNDSQAFKGEAGTKFLEDLKSWEFKKQERDYSKWWYFEGKMKDDKTLFETATFYHHVAYQVAYEMGIDVENLIEEGKALLWTP